MKADCIQSKSVATLDEIVAIACSSNDPVQFALATAELLLTNGLITEPVYDILTGAI